MFKKIVRTLSGPTRDPRMDHISRPLPRGMTDEVVLAAIDRALAVNPDPTYLPETLPAALRELTSHDYEVLDRSARDVTGSFSRSMVMIRDGGVGQWPGYAAMSYPLLAESARARETRAAIAAADLSGGSTPPGSPRKPGWEPPPPPRPVAEREPGDGPRA
ncbi:MAG: hypothetical protein ACR2KI_08940 [Candidatus Limnocylindria bacterium]